MLKELASNVLFSVLSGALGSQGLFIPEIERLVLVNADTGKTIQELSALQQGSNIDLSRLPSKNVTVRGMTNLVTESISFRLDENERTSATRHKKFSLCGYDPVAHAYLPCPQLNQVGTHTITAQPFTGKHGTGRAGAPMTISINIIDSNADRPPSTTPCRGTRGMWVWGTQDVLEDRDEQDLLIATAKSTGVTDLFLYFSRCDYTAMEYEIQNFISMLSANGIHAWGLEGSRAFFSDHDSPDEMYANVDALIAYNSKVAPNQRFIGFQSDMEPHDEQKAGRISTFHNDLCDSELNTRGGGVWYSTEAMDREMLMRDWLQIHENLAGKLHAAGLRMGAAMPKWTDDYYGEEILVTYKGLRQGVMKHMMWIVDDYAIMSYNTDPKKVINAVIGEVTYANSLPAYLRPRIYAGIETDLEVGEQVSYADTSGKNSKAAVFADIAIMEQILNPNISFCGVNIHSWDGWRRLRR